MNTKKFFIGTFVGGITFFLLGYLFYGMALANFFTQHTTNVSGSMKSMNDLVWWALILGNLAVGALLTYVFLKLGNKQSARSAYFLASKLTFDPQLQEDALFEYAKLSYELDYNQQALDATRLYLKNYPKAKRTDEVKTLLGAQGTVSIGA